MASLGVDFLPRPAVAAAVLAGGASRRMGRDKATLAVGGVALARRAAAAAAAVADPVVLVAPPGHPARTLGLPLVDDAGRGPLAALAAALAALGTAYVLVVGGDHPDLQPRLLGALVAERATAPALACRRGGLVEPLVAVYERAPTLALAERRLAEGGDRSLVGLLTALGARILPEPEWRRHDPDGRSFVDLDDPADLAAFLGAPVRPTGERGPPPG